MVTIRMIVGLLLIAQVGRAQNKIVVYQSDFGLKDGAVSEMKGQIAAGGLAKRVSRRKR